MGKSLSNYFGAFMVLSDPHASADWLYDQFNRKPDWNHPSCPAERPAATKRLAKGSKKRRK
jgi:hypothetical protein